MTDPAPTSLMTDSTTTPPTEPATPHAAPDPSTQPPADPAPSTTEDAAGSEGEGTEGLPSPEPLTLEALELPEGFELPDEVGTSFLDLVNNPPESRAEFANALLGIHTSLLENVAGEYAQRWESMQEEWRTQVQNLPEIGGQNLQKSLGEIAKVLDRYGDKEARDALALTGAGNHPALVRLFHKIAKDLNEAPPVAGSPPAGAPRDRASRMFGSSEG